LQRLTGNNKQEKLTMAKIEMTNPLVELDGDEMTRVIWSWIKDVLLLPYINLNVEYYDLGLPERERTRDKVTVDAADAISRHGVGVKCATITPNAERVREYHLSEVYKSPNATIRAILDGTVFRTPILVSGISPYIPTWEKPITIARHAYGDVYKCNELAIDNNLSAAKVELVATTPAGEVSRALIHDFNSGGAEGIVQGMYNTNQSIRSFAKACFAYALQTKSDLWFASKDTISKTYDRRFRDIFAEVFEAEFRLRFQALGIEYTYTLIDDAVARVIRSKGGFIWACKNYDGDVMSDMVASAFGSLAMMTSVLVSPEGNWEFEAAHGTVQRHYYRHQAGELTSTNPVATIFAWSGALKKRGELDANKQLCTFATNLETATLETIAAGAMTGDLLALSKLPKKRQLDTYSFLIEVASKLESLQQASL
jgi:isocitrate dehydrogenase